MNLHQWHCTNVLNFDAATVLAGCHGTDAYISGVTGVLADSLGTAGLRTLRLQLSGVRSLALALPSLTALDLNRAGELRCLELRCPALLVAYAQGCKYAPIHLAGLIISISRTGYWNGTAMNKHERVAYK